MEFDRRVMPFYMAYPGPSVGQEEELVLRDLEYFQQTYPYEVRRYHRRVAEILDKMDFEGSMIYDEYPDCYSLRHTTDSIIKVLKQEEREKNPSQPTSDEKWEWLRGLVQVLLCNEIYKRRYGGRRRFIKF
jgi:hypothetical protein